jgi:hypothetical protein
MFLALLSNSVFGDVAPPGGKEPDFLQSLKQGVQITELGCMRVAFVFNKTAAPYETRITEAFSNADFRVFSRGTVMEEPLQASEFSKLGNERHADLVVHANVLTNEKAALGSMLLVESECTVKVYSPMSSELLVSHTVRRDGKRSPNLRDATRTAVEPALDDVIKEIVAKTLEKAHKILIHEAVFKGVQDHAHLLEILTFTATLKGVYHVRQISYDKESKVAVVEIVGSPQTETFWRAYLDKLPKRELLLQKSGEARVVPSKILREKHADWFSKQ